jgi:hypothetical protein
MRTYECVLSFGKPNFRQDTARRFPCTVCLFWRGLPWYACMQRRICKLCSSFVLHAVGSATARRFVSLCSLCAVGSATVRSLPSSRSFEERWDCFACCFTCLLTSCVMKSASFDVYCCQFYVKNCRHVGFFGQLPRRNSRTTKLCPLHLICPAVSLEKHLEFEFELFAYFTRSVSVYEIRTDQARKMLCQTLCRCVVNSSFEQHRIQTKIVSYQFCMASSDVFSKRIKTCQNSSLLV